jgi:hypothetical protein
MVRQRVRPRPGCRDSPDSSFESTGSKWTVDTSSLTSCDTSPQRHLPNLPKKDELVLLRRRITTHEKREEQLINDIFQIQKKLEFSNKSINRWKQAMHDDARPGSYYRKEIVLLKQELDKKHDDIRDREITIENLMAINHPSHSLVGEHSVSQQTSVCSSLLDETVEGPQAREMERLLLENASYAHQLGKQDEEVHRLREKMAELEKDRINTKQENATYEKQGTQTAEDIAAPSSQRSVQQKEVKFEDSLLSVPFDPFGQSHSESSSHSSDRSDSIRTTKRVVELHNELNKMTKERNSARHELEQSQSEAKRLRSELYDAKLQSVNNNDELVSKLNKANFALHNLKAKEENSASALKHHQAKIREMNGIIDMQKVFELENEKDLPIQQLEIRELKKALDESLVELETAAEFMTEQRQTIQDLKKASSAKVHNYFLLQHYLQVKTESLEIVERDLMKKDAEIEELGLTIKKFGSVEKKLMLRDDEEIKGLQQKIIFLEDRYADLQKEFFEKKSEIDELSNSTLETNDDLDNKRSTQIQLKHDGPQLFNSLKEENEFLIQKTNGQTNQLQKADKILFEKELEKRKLKTWLKEMQSKLDSIDAKRVNVAVQTKRYDIDAEIVEENHEALRDENAELLDSLLSASEESKIKEDAVENLQNRIEVITAQAINQQYEMDVLVKNFAQLGASNIILEKKCKAFERDTKFYTDEIFRLYNALVGYNCEIEPLKKYIKILIDTKACDGSNLTRSNSIIDELESTRLELVNRLNRLLDVEAKETKISELEKDIIVRNNLISENSKLKEKNASNIERLNILLLEIQELKQELSNLSGANESLLSQKMKLEKEAKNSENKIVNSHVREIATLAMDKDLTINTLRQDLTASRSRSAKEIVRLTDELSKTKSDMEKQYSPDAMQMKDQRIHALERTLHLQEGTVDSLRLELRQVELSIRNTSDQRRKDLEELQKELIETQSNAMNKDRECIYLKSKLDECKIEYEKEFKSLAKDIERKDLHDTNMMLVAKQRLEQLKVVNIELKEDNLKLDAQLERALTKMQNIKAKQVEMEKECATLKKKTSDLECLLDKNDWAAKPKSQVTDDNKKGRGKRTEKGKKTKFIGWGKSAIP